MALRNDVYVGVEEDLVYSFRSALTERAVSGKKRQHLGQNLICRTDVASREEIVKPQGLAGVPIRRIDQRNPLKRVRENHR